MRKAGLTCLLAICLFLFATGCSILGTSDGGFRTSNRNFFFDFLSGGGQSAVTWLTNWQDQFHDSYYVYYDDNAAGNHFNVRGLLGAYSWITATENDTNNPQSGISCIKVTVSPGASTGLTGIYHMNGMLPANSTVPELNWGTNSSAGINLTGATELSFWARGESGGEVVKFFMGGIGYNENNQSVAPFPDSVPRIFTNITLTTTWTEYKICLSNSNLSYVLGGFGWSILKESGETWTSRTFYIDNIKYNLNRITEPRFLVSYKTLASTNYADLVLRNVAYVYDQALAIMALLAYGQNDRAKLIADALVYAQDHDRYYTDGCLRNAYMGGDLALPAGWTPKNKINAVRMPGWWDSTHSTYYEDKYCVSLNTGNMAWAALGLLSYYQKAGGGPVNQKYLDAAVKLAVWITNNMTSANNIGYIAAYEGWENQGIWRTFKSTEHNLDLYAVFTRLYLITTNSDWINRANCAKDLVMSMWDETGGFFYTGTGLDGVTINNQTWQIPLDCQCWTHLAFRTLDANYQRSMIYADHHYRYNGQYGYDFNQNLDGIWYEGTGQMATAYMLLGDQVMGANIMRVISNGNAPSGAMYAASTEAVGTGFYEDYGQWCYFKREHVGATAWAIFAEKKLNAFWIGTEFELLNSSNGGGLTNTDFTTYEMSAFITNVPAYGDTNSNSFVSGVVHAEYPFLYKFMVFTYIPITGGDGTYWWPKPTYEYPIANVNQYSNWNVDITTGGSDEFAEIIHAIIFPVDYNVIPYNNDPDFKWYYACIADTNQLGYLRVDRLDFSNPTNVFTNYAEGSTNTVTVENLTLTGSAKDTKGIEGTYISVNNGPFILQKGTGSFPTSGHFQGDLNNRYDNTGYGANFHDWSATVKLQPGINLIKLYVKDYSVNINKSATSTFYIIYDAAADRPVVAITTPSAYLNTGEFTNSTYIAGTASDGGTVTAVYVSTNGTTFYPVSGTTTWSTNLRLRVAYPSSSFTNTVFVYAVDNYSNCSQTNSVKFYYIDTTKPTVAFTYPSATLWVTNVGGISNVGGALFDNNGVMNVYMYRSYDEYSGIPVIRSISNWGTNYLELYGRSNWIYLSAYDTNYNNTNTGKMTVMLVDTETPQFSITNAVTNYSQTGMLTNMVFTNTKPSVYYLMGIKSDNLKTAVVWQVSNVSYNWSFGYTNTFSGNGTFMLNNLNSYMKVGENLFRIFALDQGGNTSVTQYVRIYIADTVAPRMPSFFWPASNGKVVTNVNWASAQGGSGGNGLYDPDNIGFKSIKISLNGGSFIDTATWWSSVYLYWNYYHYVPAGTNVYRIYTDDWAGNCSETNTYTLINVK